MQKLKAQAVLQIDMVRFLAVKLRVVAVRPTDMAMLNAAKSPAAVASRIKREKSSVAVVKTFRKLAAVVMLFKVLLTNRVLRIAIVNIRRVVLSCRASSCRTSGNIHVEFTRRIHSGV